MVYICCGIRTRSRSADTEPQVKCGAVYVSDDEKAKSVTKNVISQARTVDEKKPRSSKYSLAVGSSFGHVHSFLKDSDPVLKSLDNTKAEDKCLMLIRKPKSASKQMLKAHSWANLTTPDMHLRQSDGSLKPDPYRQFKHRSKKSQGQGSPQTGSSESHQLPASPRSPLKGTLTPNSSFKELTSVSENEEDSGSVVSSWQPKDVIMRDNVPDLVSPHLQSRTSFNGEKSQSHIDLREIHRENNNKMGSGWSQGRPMVAPPAVPQRTRSRSDGGRNDKKLTHQKDYVDERNNNVKSTLNVTLKSTQNNQKQKRSSDSGLNRYDNGFKQELTVQTETGHRVTSSPRNIQADDIYHASDNSVSKNKQEVNVKNKNEPQTRNRPEPQVAHRTELQSKNRQEPQSKYRTVPQSTYRTEPQSNYRTEPQPKNRPEPQSKNRPEPQSKNRPEAQVKSRPHTQYYPNGHKVDDGKQNVDSDKQRKNDQGKNSPKENYQQLNRNNRSEYGESAYAKLNKSLSHPQTSSVLSEYGVNQSSHLVGNEQRDIKKRKSSGEVNSSRTRPVENEEPVFRAQSMGDLSAGCTFSLVGQKKSDSYANIGPDDFTGTKLTQHFRKYREIKKESKHGSLPFRGKLPEDSAESAQNLEQFMLSAAKPSHHMSLQHIPMSNGSGQTQVRNHPPAPMKPRRSLPQVPGDVQEKKKHIGEVVKNRMSNASRSSSSRSSNTPNRGSFCDRMGGVSATPSDREVSSLLDNNNRQEMILVANGNHNECNSHNTSNGQLILPDAMYEQGVNVPCNSHQNMSFQAVPPGGRLSESGQTTLTSQSTIDSGYITMDPEQETLSTSNYAKTLKESAQTLYASNKMFKPSKGDNPHVVSEKSKIRGGNSNSAKENHSSYTKYAKETHTRNWLENHPTYMADFLKMSVHDNGSSENVNDERTFSQNQREKIDKNNNKHPVIPEQKAVINHVSSNSTSSDHGYHTLKPQLSHHASEPSQRDLNKLQQTGSQLNRRGMSLSMSQGLNLIEKQENQYGGSFLSKSQPKFTGSLKDLIGSDKQIVAIETLKADTLQTGSLPGNSKFSSTNRMDTSLKSLGKPSLFQLLQNYNLHPVRVKITDNFQIMENIRMIECEVVLPSVWINGQRKSSVMTSPKGSYAKLGGPNSAFRPVSSGGSNSIKTVSMVTIMETSPLLTECIQSGRLCKGDLIVEVNEDLMIGEDLERLGHTLQGCQGEVLLTIARDKARIPPDNEFLDSSMPTDEDFRRMEQKLTELTTELRKKDRTLKQLTALLPWKQQERRGRNSDGRDFDPDICSLSEDEFIV